MIEGARRALTKRAAGLRQEAADMSTTTEHEGRTVPLVPPEARVKARTADVLDECAEAIAPRT